MRTKRRRSVCVGLQKSLKHGQIARTRECTRRTFETQEGDTLTWGNIWRASGVSKMFVNVFSDRSVRLRPQMVERMLENDKKWDADTCSMFNVQLYQNTSVVKARQLEGSLLKANAPATRKTSPEDNPSPLLRSGLFWVGGVLLRVWVLVSLGESVRLLPALKVDLTCGWEPGELPAGSPWGFRRQGGLLQATWWRSWSGWTAWTWPTRWTWWT